MSRDVAIPLESYRLAQYAAGIPCYICHDSNTYDAELCRHCAAPMSLAHQAQSQKIRPQMIAAIGASGVGKTVYLGMLLDMLSRVPDRLQMLARGAFSITLQQSVAGALSRCEFPSKTPSEPDRWNWVHCQVRRRIDKHPVDLIMPDLAGEALLAEVEHPRTYPVIQSLLQQSAGVLILIDAAELHAGERDQDYFTMKLLTYLAELDGDAKSGWHDKPVALVFTKADQCEECFADPADYASAHAAGVWQQCQKRFGRHAFFATGVVGGCAFREVRGVGRVRFPLRIEPRGVIEPFEWLVAQLHAGQKRRPARR